MTVPSGSSGSPPAAKALGRYELADEILRRDLFQLDPEWARLRALGHAAGIGVPLEVRAGVAAGKDPNADGMPRRPTVRAVRTLIGPKRSSAFANPGRRRRLVVAAVLAFIALAGAHQTGLTGATSKRLTGVLDAMPAKVGRWVRASPRGTDYRKRPARARDERAATLLVASIVDSLTRAEWESLDRHGVQPIPKDWLTPQYLLGPADWPGVPDEMSARLAFVVEVQPRMPTGGTLDRDLQARIAVGEPTVASVQVFASESLHAWRARRLAEWRRVAEHARAALELHDFLIEHQGDLLWDDGEGRLIHADAEVTERAAQLLAAVTQLGSADFPPLRTGGDQGMRSDRTSSMMP